MDILNLKSICRKKRKNHKKSTPEIVAEMKYGIGQKAYLSAILDLADKSIVSFMIGYSNNNNLAFKTFDVAHQKHPDVTPIFHSYRGFQYISKIFKNKLNQANMTQSMSRVSCCIDNDPMEAFWGMLKSEMYYLKKFSSYDELKEAIIDIKNVLTP
ncbi:DDE-type integrase/transposase/recombinase [Clostridium sp. ATCC 25772]|uniref:IS3 family transposase n=1 Tax=Clostridium sp. ATCC 25772 TaxID=1676991 RepID=UPI0009E6F53B|nr:DDE-type integrase/transposase/recombinase [Clostridium sp. ATCC 25772]